MPAAHLLSNHYNQTRSEYYRQLSMASKSNGDVLPFINYAVQGLVDGLKSQIAHIRKQHFSTTWQNYVHDKFRDRKGVAEERRKHLVLDLSKETSAIPPTRIPELSTRLAIAYGKRTRTTITRDLNVLLGLDLIRKEETGYVANKDLITAFLPMRVNIGC